MMARQVDERDGQWEDQALGYRVVILRENGVDWHTFDVESETLTPVESWALERSGGCDFSIAARVATDGGVGLIWLTPPPETFSEEKETR